MAGLLTCAAGAAQVGTINNNYPGDTEAQAQMLYDLGLFKGTDKGFALEKSMTRAEASVMLTRLLAQKRPRGRKLGASVYRCAAVGGQIRRLAVSEWFDQGRFRDTVRLAAQCHLRPVLHFLTRAHLDADSYQGTAFVDNDEVRQTDEEGFIRGDAVSLSARLLSTNYAKMAMKATAVWRKS